MKKYYVLINGKDSISFGTLIAANDCFNALSRTIDEIDLKLCIVNMAIGSAPITQSHYTNITSVRADEIADLEELSECLNPNQ